MDHLFLAISLLMGITFFFMFGWFIWWQYAKDGTPSALHNTGSPKCPRQECLLYKVKCGVCCRQVREDKFVAFTYFGEASIKNGIEAQKVIDELKQRQNEKS